MRACQQCGEPINNNVKVCPHCGAEQQPSVGLEKNAADGQTNPPIGAEPKPPKIVDRLEKIDFDPGNAAWLCLLLLLGICLIVAIWNPTAALILGAVCGLIAFILMLVMG